MTIIRLDPPIWLHTPKGEALAHFLIAETEMDLVWVCAQQGNPEAGCQPGECWSWSNDKIRFMNNLTIGRKVDTPTRMKPEDVTATKIRERTNTDNYKDAGRTHVAYCAICDTIIDGDNTCAYVRRGLKKPLDCKSKRNL